MERGRTREKTSVPCLRMAIWLLVSPGIETSVAQLRAWYQQMDEEMKAVVEGFSDDDLKKTIDRGGYEAPVDMQLDVYLQAQLIFFGKASIYCKSLGIEMTPTFKEYIG